MKPDNVLIGQRGELLLSDFGVALIAATTQAQNAETKLAGTALYMAPEQSRGKPLFASDQYALGIMVYEWLCGTRPFHGSLIELYSQHYFVPPAPLREHVPALSLEVEHVVLRALAKSPDQRFASVKDFARALKQAGQSTQIMDAIDGVRGISTQTQLAVSTSSQDSSDAYRTISSSDTSGGYRTISSQDSADMYRTVLSQDDVDIAPVTPLEDGANATGKTQAMPLSNALDHIPTGLLQEPVNDAQVTLQQDYGYVPPPASLQNPTSQMKWARLISLNVSGLHKRLVRGKVSLLVGLAIIMMLIFSVSLIYASNLQGRRQASSNIPTATSASTATSYANGGIATSTHDSLTVTPGTSTAKPVSTVGPLSVVNPKRVPATPTPTAVPTATPTPTPTPTAVLAIPTPIPVSEPPTPTPTPVLAAPQITPTPTPTPAS